MKIIPKYQTGSSFDKYFNLLGNITWNNDWGARDESGNLINNDGKIYNDLKGLNSGRYDYDRTKNYKYDYEDLNWYTTFHQFVNQDDNLKRKWAQSFYDNSTDTNPYKEVVGRWLNNGQWTDPNKRFESFDKFYGYLTNDRRKGIAHYTMSGSTYINPTTGETHKDIPDGWEVIPEKEYDDAIKSKLGKYKADYGLENLINFNPIRIKQQQPSNDSEKDNSLDGDNSKLAQAKEKMGRLSSAISTVHNRLQGEFDKNRKRNVIPGNIPPWLKSTLGKFGQRVGGLFNKKNENEDDKENGFNIFSDRGKQISPFWAQTIRTAIDNAFNTRSTEKLINDMDVPLANYTPVYRQIHGDYIAQQQAQREASRFRTSQPITANQQIQSATDLEGVQRGNQLIEQGNAKDAQMFWNTSEQAFQQAKENARGWDAIANQNRQRLSEFNNKIAELRFKTRNQNMQNWDTLFTDMETRMWEKRDREDALRTIHKEELEDLFDKRAGLASIDNELYQLEQLRRAAISAGKTDLELRDLNNRILKLENIKAARQHYNKLRRYNLYNPEQWKQLYGDNADYDFDNPNWEANVLGYLNKLAQNSENETYDETSTLPGRQSGIQGIKRKEHDFKNGGILSYLQTGGAFGVVAGSSAGKGNKYLQAFSKSGNNYSSTSSKSSSKSSDDDDDKTRDKLLGNIAETLKGIDGLNSDVNILYKELTNFFDIQRYSSLYSNSSIYGNNLTDPMQFYSMYIRALNRVNQVKQSAKQFDSAYKELEKKDAMTSPAIDSNGYVFVGLAGTDKIQKISPAEYLKNSDKYHLIRNNELLDLRRNDQNYAFSDKYITEVAYNGTNMQEIHKFIKDVIGKVGSSTEGRDLLIKQFGSDAVQGIQTLSQLIQKGESNPETAQIIAGLKGTLTEVNVTTQNQIEQAKMALAAIGSMLPANMKTMLMLQSGSAENMEKMLTMLVFQGLDTSIQFKINGISQLDENGNPAGGTGKGKSGDGSGGGSEEAEERTLLNIVEGKGGTYDKLTINPGTKSQLTVGAVNYQVEGAYSPSSLSTALSQTKIMGISDPRKIYFGDQLVKSNNLKDIYYSGNGFSRVILPIKSDGSPDFTLFQKFEKACDNVRAKGGNPLNLGDQQSQKLLAKELEGTGLYNLVKGDMPDLTKVGLFLVTEGQSTSKIGIKSSSFVKQKSNADYNELRKGLGEKGPDGKYVEYELDEPNWYLPLESIFNTSYDKVYEATIYIPINNNPLQATTASGNKRKQSAAMQQEKAYQASNNLRKYNSNNELIQ